MSSSRTTFINNLLNLSFVKTIEKVKKLGGGGCIENYVKNAHIFKTTTQKKIKIKQCTFLILFLQTYSTPISDQGKKHPSRSKGNAFDYNSR